VAPIVDDRLLLAVFVVPLAIFLVTYLIVTLRADSVRELLEFKRRI